MRVRPRCFSFTGGQRVRDVLDAKSDAELVEDALAAIELVTGETPPTPTASFVTRWQTDPYCLGSYTYPALGQSLEDFDTLAEPIEDRVLFAGEGTSSDYFGTVHGALHSGIREAMRLGGEGAVASSIVNAGSKMLGCSLMLLQASCSAATRPTEPPTAAEANTSREREPTKTESPEAPDLAEILAGLYLVSRASQELDAEDGDECEREGYPASLSEQAAAELGDAAPGKPVVIVHDEGQTRAAVVGVGCREAEEYEAGATILELSHPAGRIPDDVPPGLIMYIPPYLAFVGVQPSPQAILSSPLPLERGPDEDAAFRAAIQSAAKRISGTRAAICLKEAEFSESAVPQPDRTAEAADRAKTWQIQAPSPTLWVLFNDPAVTFGCDPEYEPELVGVLIDVATNTSVLAVQSNSTVELQWATDLDGDGTQEALLDVTWLEDGGHMVSLIHRGEKGWELTTLYAADGP